jgi:hypothetical protein
MAMQRIYKVTHLIKNRVTTCESKGNIVEQLSLTLVKDGKKLERVQGGVSEVFAMLRKAATRHEDARELKVKLLDSERNTLLKDRYTLLEKTAQSYTGLDAPPSSDISTLVEQKVQQIRQAEELERLRSEQVELKAKNEELLGQVETLEAQVEAKSNLEYYSKVAGDLLPGLAKALEKSPIGATLGTLAGNNTTVSDDQSTVLEVAQGLIATLDDEKLSAFYMFLLELQNNPALIPALYQNAFSNETEH